MTKRIVVDPITRIEGHLRMEADIENGVITDAFSTGTMIRGIEIIVKDRDPRDVWAYVGRVCGVCTSIQSSRRCATHRHSAECRAGEKPHAIGRNHTRSRYTLLSITGSRLGRCHVGLECRPQKGSRSGAKPIGMA